MSPLLSDADALALHQHFLHVELDRIDNEIDDLSAEIASLSYDIADGPSLPAGLPPFSKPPNRHQVIFDSFLKSIIAFIAHFSSITYHSLISGITNNLKSRLIFYISTILQKRVSAIHTYSTSRHALPLPSSENDDFENVS